MRIKSPDPQPRDDGEFHVYVNGHGYGKPYGIIYLDEGKALALRDITLSDARRLAAAVARVERELAAACAEMAAPHGREHLWEGTCQLCGKPEDDGLHADPCAAVSPDGDACTEPAGHAGYHYGPDKGAGVRRMWEDEDDGTTAATLATIAALPAASAS